MQFTIPLLSIVLVAGLQEPTTPPAGESSEPRASTATPEFTASDVEARLAAVEGDGSLDEVAKSSLRQRFQEILRTLEEAERLDAAAKDFRQSITEGPNEEKRLEAEVEALESPEAAAQSAFQLAEKDGYEQVADRERAQLAQFEERLSEVVGEVERLRNRPVDLGQRLVEVQRELAQVRTRLGSAEFATEPSSHTGVADLYALRADETKLVAEMEALQQERDSLEARQRVREAELTLLRQRIENARAVVDAVEKGRLQDANTRLENVRRIVESAVSQAPDDEGAGARKAALVESFEDLETVIEGIGTATTAVAELSGKTVAAREELERLKGHLEGGGAGAATAQLLLDIRRRSRRSAREIAGLGENLPDLEETRASAFEITNALHDDGLPRSAEGATTDGDPLIAARRVVLVELDAR